MTPSPPLPPPRSSLPWVLCPLAAERDALRRTTRWAQLSARATIVVIGPGPGGVQRWFSEVEPPADSLVLLAGVAGGLVAEATVGSAGMVGAVVTPSGDLIARPSSLAASAARWSVVGVDRPVAQPAAKTALAAASGATIVDMESHAFARLATTHQLRWGIARGVSDGLYDQLPEGIETLVDSDGQTRLGKAMVLLAKRPAMLRSLRELGRRTQHAMRNVALLLDAVLAGEAER